MVAKPVKGPDMDRVYQLAEVWTVEGGRLDIEEAFLRKAYYMPKGD